MNELLEQTQAGLFSLMRSRATGEGMWKETSLTTGSSNAAS